MSELPTVSKLRKVGAHVELELGRDLALATQATAGTGSLGTAGMGGENEF